MRPTPQHSKPAVSHIDFFTWVWEIYTYGFHTKPQKPVVMLLCADIIFVSVPTVNWIQMNWIKCCLSERDLVKLQHVHRAINVGVRVLDVIVCCTHKCSSEVSWWGCYITITFCLTHTHLVKIFYNFFLWWFSVDDGCNAGHDFDHKVLAERPPRWWWLHVETLNDLT